MRQKFNDRNTDVLNARTLMKGENATGRAQRLKRPLRPTDVPSARTLKNAFENATRKAPGEFNDRNQKQKSQSLRAIALSLGKSRAAGKGPACGVGAVKCVKTL